MSHLHVEQRGAVARPLLGHRHVLDHGRVLAHALQLPPLVRHAGPHRRRLLPQPRLQAVLLLQLLPTQRAAPEAPPQRSLQEARALPLRGPRAGAGSEGPGRVLHAGPQPRHGEHQGHVGVTGLGAVVALQVLKPQGSQELEGLLGARVPTPDHGFMGLWTKEPQIEPPEQRGQHTRFTRGGLREVSHRDNDTVILDLR